MKISVCMATYNGEKYIYEQLISILSQLSINDEVIISDDHSTDNTIEIIKSLNDNRIKIVYNSLKLGVVNNFQHALSYVSGDIVFLSDQDDVWLDSRVENAIDKLKEFDAVVLNCSITDNELNIIEISYFNFNKSKCGFLYNLYKSSYLGCCLAFNRNVLDYVLPIPSNLMMYHDWWFGILIELKFNVFFDSRPSLLYRRHFETASPTSNKSQRSFYLKIYSRIQLLNFALKHYFKGH